MSKISRNIDASDRLMLRTSQLEECQLELAELRSWKEKARPWIEAFEIVKDSMTEEQIATLTELLGGSDGTS